MEKRLAIITTHPIQYNAPFFALLTQRNKFEVKVFYTWGEKVLKKKYDPGFEKDIKWDIPLLEGYNYEFVVNVSKDPGSHHFNGIDNPHLIDVLIDWNPRAILVFGWSFKSHSNVMKYFKGKVFILFRGDSNLLDEPPGFSLKKIVRRLFLKWMYSFIDTALYVGTANHQYFRKHGLKEKQLLFAPHAIDNDRFYVSDTINDKARNMKVQMGINENAVVFLFAGKLELKKNPAILIRAFKKLDINHAHLVIVGNGKLKANLENLSGQHSHIHFMDFQNQSVMPVVYTFADIFILPSTGPGETWGLSVNEAMAAGKAVIVSDKCGCAVDLVENGENGYIFQSQDLDGLVTKMRLLANKKIAKKFGDQSFQKIKTWNYTEICSAIEQALYYFHN